MWKSPTPHEESLSKIDNYLLTHRFTPKELDDIRRFYGGNRRIFGLRHLRLTAAFNRIGAMMDPPKPPIELL